MSRIKLTTVMMAAALFGGCTAPPASHPSAEPAAAKVSGAPAVKIVDLVGRDEVITISAGPAGPLYSARTHSGHLLVADATLQQLRTEHPDIYLQISGAASVDPAPVLDGRVDLDLAVGGE